MSIVSHGRAWFLDTPNATYAIGINADGHLQHWHWGTRIRVTDLGAWRPPLQRAFGSHEEGKPESFSLDFVPAEYPFPGSGDFRSPAIEVEHADGTRTLRLRYEAHRILAGKPRLAGLPATYVESDTEADTLEIDLRDELGAIVVTLAYTAFAEHDAIARSARITNHGPDPVRVLRLLSASVDLPESPRRRWLHLHGAWARERQISEQPLRPGSQTIESRTGTSGHMHNPFFALLEPGTDEEHGEVRAFSLVYSGNFLAGVELDTYGLARAQIGINPAGFAWHLGPGSALQSPEGILVFSGQGVGGMSRTFHRLYRTRLCRGPWRDRPRPVLINNWEATYFDFDEERIVDLARRARPLGVQLLVLDDGWFKGRRDARTSLGDWQVDREKLPGGLERLVERLAREGLQFGLWFEPEMVSPDSDLHRAHPDWCLHIPGRGRTTIRHQLVLDFSRAEVRAAIHTQLAALLRAVPIRYVKWDMNRYFTEAASAALSPEQQTETPHRCVLGLYALLEQITGEFPEVLFECCAGGGGRFDPGMLHYMPQVWTSDNTDAISRLRIQHGTSLVYPLGATGAHISASPNHQTHRTTSLTVRACAAMTGAFGLELDLAKLTPEELRELAQHIETHRALAPLLAQGDLHRLKNPFEDDAAAWMVVSRDQTEAAVFHVVVLSEANAPLHRLRLRGLNPEWDYRDVDSEEILGGDALMHHGLMFAATEDFTARTWRLARA